MPSYGPPCAVLKINMSSYHWLSDADRLSLALRHAHGLESLQEGNVHLLAVSRRYDADVWAEQLRLETPRYAAGWPRYLEEQRQHVGRSGSVGYQAFLLKELDRPRRERTGLWGLLLNQMDKFDRIMDLEDPTILDGELDQLRQSARSIRGQLRQARVPVELATLAETRWLVSRHLYLGISEPPQPRRWQAWGGELLTLGSARAIDHTSYVELQQGDQRSCLATVCLAVFPSSEACPGFEYSRNYRGDHLADYSCRIRIQSAHAATKEAKAKLRRVKDQIDHTLDAQGEVALELDEKHSGMKSLQYEITKERRPPFEAWHRLQLWARSPKELEAKVTELKAHFRDLQIDAERPSGDQLDLYLETLPGDRLRTPWYGQRQRALTITGGAYWATDAVGDNHGCYFGYTTDQTELPVHFDPHHWLELDYPPVVEIAGVSGQGKSVLFNVLGYQFGLRDVTVVGVDPSPKRDGSMMLGLEGLQGRTNPINLDDSTPGALDPWRVAGDPGRGSELAVQFCQSFLPARLADEVEGPLLRAAKEVQKEARPSLIRMVQVLRDMAKNEPERPRLRDAVDILDAMSDQPGSKIAFGSGEGEPFDLIGKVTVFQFSHGLALPKAGTARESWSQQERVGVGLMYALGYLLNRLLDVSPETRKAVMFDESHILTAFEQGQRLFDMLSRTLRKNNGILVLSTQNPSDNNDPAVGNQVLARFIFAVANQDEQTEAIKQMRVEDTPRIRVELKEMNKVADEVAPVAPGADPLSLDGPDPRSDEKGFCFFQDPLGRVSMIRVDLFTAEFRRQLNTTPPSQRVVELARSNGHSGGRVEKIAPGPPPLFAPGSTPEGDLEPRP